MAQSLSRLQRTASFRQLHPYLDSSESDVSDHSSVYDAPLYAHLASENTTDGDDEDIFGPPEDDTALPTVEATNSAWESDSAQELVEPSGEWDDSAAPVRPPRVPYRMKRFQPAPPRRRPAKRTWVTPSLAPIAEQRSHSTLRTTHSFPGLARVASTGTSSNIGTTRPAQEPPNPSITPRSPSPQPSPDSVGKPRRRKSRSLDDSSLPSCLASLRRPVCSDPSSDEDDQSPNVPVGPYPTNPLHPPPFRRPTPPGLPSFGSREAMRYQPRHRIITPEDTRPLMNAPSQGVLGFFERVFSPPNQQSPLAHTPRTVGLPPGVIAMAADGTMVRGRFGIRQSSHMGMTGGTAGLERHSYHRDEVPVAETVGRETADVDGPSRDRETRTVRFRDQVQTVGETSSASQRKNLTIRTLKRRSRQDRDRRSVKAGTTMQRSSEDDQPPRPAARSAMEANRAALPALQGILNRNGAASSSRTSITLPPHVHIAERRRSHEEGRPARNNLGLAQPTPGSLIAETPVESTMSRWITTLSEWYHAPLNSYPTIHDAGSSVGPSSTALNVNHHQATNGTSSGAAEANPESTYGTYSQRSPALPRDYDNPTVSPQNSPQSPAPASYNNRSSSEDSSDSDKPPQRLGNWFPFCPECYSPCCCCAGEETRTEREITV